ncbi:MAG: FixH family protein [Filomicrobium sp.]
MSTYQPMANPNHSGWTLTGWHVLGAILVFFSVLFVVNGVFLYYAITTFTGIETSDAYRKGISYNQNLQEERRFEQLGWQGKIAGDGKTIKLTLLTQDGTPVRGMDVSGKVGRPATDKFDQTVTFKDQGNGIYAAKDANLAPGNWIVVVEVREPVSQNSEPRFRLKERLWLSQ